MDNTEKAVLEERAKRKELSRVRIFWFLVFVDIALIAYIVIQMMILANNG